MDFEIVLWYNNVMEIKLPEILAPVGNFESLRAAVVNGANAVYLGLKDFSARAKADNFSFDELSQAIAYAHLFGVKVYIAVNTLIKNSEMAMAIEHINTAAKLGADAFIIQDLGLLNNIRNSINVPLHASTQMGIHNTYGAEFAKKCGFDRVILSRETTLKDIREIKKNVDIEVETFVQGALCVAFSGNCLFSSLVSGYSGNRGKCLQLCRKKYELDINGLKSSGYNLSAKDICLLSDLKDLFDAGVDSFKIEGRMRRAEYVGESVSVYRHAIESLGKYNDYSVTDGEQQLKKIFNRGDYCRGYLHMPTENVIYPLVQGHKGVKIGTVEKVMGKSLILHSKQKVFSGDGLKFINETGETGGCLVTDSENIISNGNVKKGDDVFLTTDSKQLEEIRKRDRILEITYDILLQKNQPIKGVISCGKIKKTVVSSFYVQKAKTAPINSVTVVDIFSKGTVYPFKVTKVVAKVDDNIFVTIGQLKEFRRLMEQEMISAITDKNYSFRKRLNYGKEIFPFDEIKQDFGKPKIILNVDSQSFIDEFDETSKIDAFIFSPTDYSDIENIERVFSKSSKPIFLNTPIMARDKDLDILKKIADLPCVENIIANNLYALELFGDKNILLGDGLNLLNDSIAKEKVASLERDVFSKNDYLTVFSQVAIMLFAHCPYKNLNGACDKNCKGYSGKLVDERGNSFPFSRYKVKYCYAKLKNELPVFLEEEARKKGIQTRSYDFRGASVIYANRFLYEIFSNRIPSFKHTHFNYNKVLR